MIELYSDDKLMLSSILTSDERITTVNLISSDLSKQVSLCATSSKGKLIIVKLAPVIDSYNSKEALKAKCLNY